MCLDALGNGELGVDSKCVKFDKKGERSCREAGAYTTVIYTGSKTPVEWDILTFIHLPQSLLITSEIETSGLKTTIPQCSVQKLW